MSGGAAELVIITGVTSGLGKALFQRFAALDGYAVAGCGRRSDLLDGLRRESSSEKATLHCVDVADDQAVAEWAKVRRREVGRAAVHVLSGYP